MGVSSKSQTSNDKDILERVRIILGREWRHAIPSTQNNPHHRRNFHRRY